MDEGGGDEEDDEEEDNGKEGKKEAEDEALDEDAEDAMENYESSECLEPLAEARRSATPPSGTPPGIGGAPPSVTAPAARSGSPLRLQSSRIAMPRISSPGSVTAADSAVPSIALQVITPQPPVKQKQKGKPAGGPDSNRSSSAKTASGVPGRRNYKREPMVQEEVEETVLRYVRDLEMKMGTVVSELDSTTAKCNELMARPPSVQVKHVDSDASDDEGVHSVQRGTVIAAFALWTCCLFRHVADELLPFVPCHFHVRHPHCRSCS